MIISIALSRGALTWLTDSVSSCRRQPACCTFSTPAVWLTRKPATNQLTGLWCRLQPVTATTVVVIVVIDWQSAYKAALAQRTYTVFTRSMTSGFTGSTNRPAAWKTKPWDAVGCCISVISGSPAVFHLVFFSTQYMYEGKLKTNRKKTQIKVSKLIQNFPRQLGNTWGFIERRNNSCNAVRRSSEWRNRVRGRVWMANQTVLVFQMAFPSRK